MAEKFWKFWKFWNLVFLLLHYLPDILVSLELSVHISFSIFALGTKLNRKSDDTYYVLVHSLKLLSCRSFWQTTTDVRCQIAYLWSHCWLQLSAHPIRGRRWKVLIWFWKQKNKTHWLVATDGSEYWASRQAVEIPRIQLRIALFARQRGTECIHFQWALYCPHHHISKDIR